MNPTWLLIRNILKAKNPLSIPGRLWISLKLKQWMLKKSLLFPRKRCHLVTLGRSQLSTGYHQYCGTVSRLYDDHLGWNLEPFNLLNHSKYPLKWIMKKKKSQPLLMIQKRFSGYTDIATLVYLTLRVVSYSQTQKWLWQHVRLDFNWFIDFNRYFTPWDWMCCSCNIMLLTCTYTSSRNLKSVAGCRRKRSPRWSA